MAKQKIRALLPIFDFDVFETLRKTGRIHSTDVSLPGQTRDRIGDPEWSRQAVGALSRVFRLVFLCVSVASIVQPSGHNGIKRVRLFREFVNQNSTSRMNRFSWCLRRDVIPDFGRADGAFER